MCLRSCGKEGTRCNILRLPTPCPYPKKSRDLINSSNGFCPFEYSPLRLPHPSRFSKVGSRSEAYRLSGRVTAAMSASLAALAFQTAGSRLRGSFHDPLHSK